MREVILCEECTRNGRTTAGTIADHILPLAKGGSGDQSNYQLLCAPCSSAKTDADAGRSTKARGVDRFGRPTDPSHPWNKR
jgi:5-methylcytosine-specific restriction protein A